MNQFMKKTLCIMLSATMLAGVCACTERGDRNEPETVTVREELQKTQLRILLGVEEMPADYQNVSEEINKQLAKSGKPYTVKLDFSKISGYMVDLESKAKNGYDAAWGYIGFLPALIEKGIIKQNLGPYLEKWGDGILDGASSYVFDDVTDFRTDGIYAIPAFVPTANGTEIQLIRKDWMLKVGMTEVKTLAQFDQYLAKVNQDKDIAYVTDPTTGESTRKAGFYAHTPDYYNSFLLREYCPTYYFPITQDGKRPVYIDIDAPSGKFEVKSFYQSQAFINVISKSRSYLDAGYVNLSQNLGSENLFYKGYTASISDYAVMKMSERISKFKAALPDGEMLDFLIETKATPRTVFQTAGDTMVALKMSTHTEELIDFLNWTKDQAHHDLLCYGVEGRNYYLTENGRITYTHPETGAIIPAEKRYADYMPYWALNDIRYLRFNKDLSQEYVDSVKNWEGVGTDGKPNYRISPLTGFSIRNTDALIIAKNKVMAVDEVVNSLMRGVEKYDRVIDAFGKTVYERLVQDLTQGNAMRDLITEVQRQLDEFLASKN